MPVYKDSRGRYTVDFRAQGRRIFRRCPEGATKAQALAYEARLRADLWNQKLGRSSGVSLASAINSSPASREVSPVTFPATNR